MPSPGIFRIHVEPTETGQRLDALIATRIDDCSRSLAAHLIHGGWITVNGAVRKPGYRVHTGDRIDGRIPPPESARVEPEAIELDILYEDGDLVVVNKQPGIVVHPAPGHPSGTLVNALLHHCPAIGPIGFEHRPGIVHRLDKDTSGVLVIAKNAKAHTYLTRQFANRTVHKIYLALVLGQMPQARGKIELSLGRHPTDRKRISTRTRRPRMAVTTWQVRENFGEISLLELVLKTGRTHQARVHVAAIGHPIIGDPVYGRRKSLQGLSKPVRDLSHDIQRQMLHAWRLTCLHPLSSQPIQFEAPIPADMRILIDKLRRLPEAASVGSRA
jgi:23S rRNA pseudouridine1911/1915/1917 synthase